MQIFEVCWWLTNEFLQCKFSLKFECRVNIVCDMGPIPTYCWGQIHPVESLVHFVSNRGIQVQVPMGEVTKTVGDLEFSIFLFRKRLSKLLQHDSWKRVSVNLLVPWWFELNYKLVIFKLNLVIDGWGIYCDIAFRSWFSLDIMDDKSTLVQVMVWCHQETNHYLGQYWPRSLSALGVTRPQWVKISLTYLLIEAVWHM